MSLRSLSLKATLLLTLALPCAPAMAQSGDQLFAKKTVTIYIATRLAAAMTSMAAWSRVSWENICRANRPSSPRTCRGRAP